MADIHSAEVRSRNMAAIKGKDTKPELMIRKALYREGFRYRVNVKTLPGKPDLVFARYRAVIFINGCFWHRHDCYLFKWPQTKQAFWQKKLAGNVENDAKKTTLLQEAGWRIGIVWGCAFKGRYRRPLEEITASLADFLRSERGFIQIEGKEGAKLRDHNAE